MQRNNMATYTISIKPSDHQFTANDDQSILDAALAAGIVLPYSCRAGACSSCKGKVLSGDYEAGPAPAQILQAEEIDQGFTLFCQAHPKSDMVIESREVRLATDIQIRKLPARLTKLTKAAPDVAILTLQLPSSETFRFYAGQYVEIILKDGKRRSYSMANSPDNAASLELHVRHMPGGLFTDHVFGTGQTQMKEREILRLEGPFGSFFLREDTDKPIVFLASGTGFAPIKAILEHMIEQGIHRQAVLYWGGRRPQDLYMDELARTWEQQLPGFRYIPVVSDALEQDHWDGRTGFVHQAVMKDYPDLSGHEVYACGAPIVVESARRDLVSQCGLPDDAFFADAFTSAADSAEV
jgi:CDP-4-dehydro-6-deoxyglucose reductase